MAGSWLMLTGISGAPQGSLSLQNGWRRKAGWGVALLLPPFLLFRSTQVDRKPHRLLGAAAQAGLERPWHPAKHAAKEQHPRGPLFPALLAVLSLEQAVPACSSH